MRSPGALPTRRALLGGALAGLAAPALAGCTSSPGTVEPPPVPRDVVAADRAAERERRLLAAYDAALAQAPQLGDLLRPLREAHVAHLAALGLPLEPAPAAGADPAATPPADPSTGLPTGPVPTPLPSPPALPADVAELPSALADLERRAGAAHAQAAVLGGRGVGAVLASLAACEASHVVALT